MVSRLLLGCGTVGRSVAADPAVGPGEVLVLEDDERRVEVLRDEGIPAEVAAYTDPDVLAGWDPDVVFAAGDDVERNLAAARAAREAFGDRFLLAYVPEAGPAADSLRSVADDVVDASAVLATAVREVTVDESADLTRDLQTTLRRLEGPLAVVMHDNPDPDAIGAAVALVALAEGVGLDATACYYGSINHQENRALVNLLDLRLRNLTPDDAIDEFESVALVDHARPGVNDQLPEDTAVDVVIDHHPPRGVVEAGFVDLRHEFGATSTILVDHLRRLGFPFDRAIATALLYGIRVDTDDLSREASTADFEAAATLLAHVDDGVLRQVETPSMSADTLETLGQAIGNRRVESGMLTSYVRGINDRDALAQAADLLVTMEGVVTTVVFGILESDENDDVVYVSARSHGGTLDLGETLRDAFGQIGSAGGHADMAGAQIPLRSLWAFPVSSEETRHEIVEAVIAERFYETVEQGVDTQSPVDDPVSGTWDETPPGDPFE